MLVLLVLETVDEVPVVGLDEVPDGMDEVAVPEIVGFPLLDGKGQLSSPSPSSSSSSCRLLLRSHWNVNVYSHS